MRLRIILLVLASAAVGVLITLAIVGRGKEEEQAAEAPAPKRVTVENGEPVVIIDLPMQSELGIVVTPLAGTTRTEEQQAFGNVVDVKELADYISQSAAARGQARQAEAKAAFDRAEYERRRTLNADNRNVSDKAVQEALSAVNTDNAQVAAANASLQAAYSAVVQRFGPAIGEALATQSALAKDLVEMRQVLVQITFVTPSAALGVTAPQTLRVEAGDGTAVNARLLSAAPRVDPKLQGRSYFYLAPAGKLAAGMNVAARFAGTRAVQGVVVPRDAVVSWEGKSWVYVRRAPTKFARREVSVATPVADGFFESVLAPGNDVVTTGAQQLLSEEMRAQLHEA